MRQGRHFVAQCVASAVQAGARGDYPFRHAGGLSQCSTDNKMAAAVMS